MNCPIALPLRIDADSSTKVDRLLALASDRIAGDPGLASGASGGWMASCIPPAMYRVFLAAWLSSSKARQLELFA